MNNQEIIEKYEHVITAIAKKYANSYRDSLVIEWEDLAQDCRLVIFKANIPSNLKDEQAYVAKICYNMCNKAVDTERNQKYVGSIWPVERYLQNPDDAPAAFHEALAELEEHYQHVLHGIYKERLSYRELADKLGVSHVTVGKYHEKAIKLIDKYLERVGANGT